MRDLILWLHEMFPDIRITRFKVAVDQYNAKLLWEADDELVEFFGWINLLIYGVKLEYFISTVVPTLSSGIPGYEVVWENGYKDRVVIRIRKRKTKIPRVDHALLDLVRGILGPENDLANRHQDCGDCDAPPQE